MMATYFHGNSDQIQAADQGGLQTLVLMNHSYVPYPDTPPPPAQPPTNLVFLNPPPPLTNSLPPHAHFSHATPSNTQQFVTIPLPSTTSNPTTAYTSSSSQYDVSASALHGSFIPHVHYNLWNPVVVDPSTAARETQRPQQGLSLSLSSEHPDAGFGAFQADRRHEVLPSPQAQAQQAISGRSPNSSASGTTVNNVAPNNIQGVLLSSRYMRATQELLEEVVSVGNNGLHTTESLKKRSASLQQMKPTGDSSVGGSGDGSIGSEAAGEKHGNSELSAAERQEIQMKKAKLISMLDEVEQRYRQYHHQMQIVTSAFKQVAGIGAARTYTSLALQMISKQFRCLKDTITSQIRAANKRLGEEESLGKKQGSRLKYLDHHIRQQSALQQLGMIQHNAWRTQRGLPERSVSVLRSWFFEHFLHPYPKDSDKHMLAKQTGLTRSQVSNWFINARVRLWKPMVEEMYLEEIKEQEQNGSEGGNKIMNKSNTNNNEDSTISKSTSTPQDKSCAAAETQSQPPTNSNAVSSPVRGNVRNQSGFITLIGSSELDQMTQGSPKKQKDSGQEHNNSSEHVFMNCSNENQRSRDGYPFMGGFGQYLIGEIPRFEAEQYPTRFSSGNGVSLTLGLPHGENLSLSAAHQTFLPPNQIIHLGRRIEMEEQNEFGAISSSTTVPHSSSTAFENLNIQNRKRFVAKLMPDYVA